MAPIDYFVIVLYGLGIIVIGSILAKRNKSFSDMFAVKKQAPWWLSGLSGFMSAFSAGTFVVWGGIAFKEGFVAVSILMCSGISSFLIGRFIAPRWAGLSITTIGEYIRLRFGNGVVQFYTWVGMLFKIIAMGVALYAFAIVVSSLIDVPQGFIFRDKNGHIPVNVVIWISGILMLCYAVSGGLWAVLIIDAIQFIVLMVTVLFVVPLCFRELGGFSTALHRLPAGFLNPVSSNFGLVFLLGWVIVHLFKLGGEWVFVQRFLSVRSPSEASKASYLLGFLYIVSPVIWMLPPILFHVSNPSADPESAYIMACASVLPTGMIGLLVAAMFSSAASYIDGEVNVYAGALTDDFYKKYFRPHAGQKELVTIGRFFSILIGLLIVGTAINMPAMGGAEKVVLTVTSLLTVALVLPPIWALFGGNIGPSAVWWTTGLSVLATFVCKGMLLHEHYPVAVFYQQNQPLMDVYIGILVPLLTLGVFELITHQKRHNPKECLQKSGNRRIKNRPVPSEEDERPEVFFPARLLGYSLMVLAAVMAGIGLYSSKPHDKFLMLVFALVLLFIGLCIQLAIRRRKKHISKIDQIKNETTRS